LSIEFASSLIFSFSKGQRPKVPNEHLHPDLSFADQICSHSNEVCRNILLRGSIFLHLGTYFIIICQAIFCYFFPACCSPIGILFRSTRV
jgi:hypothetical protein